MSEMAFYYNNWAEQITQEKKDNLSGQKYHE